jgi:hypothetical protein
MPRVDGDDREIPGAFPEVIDEVAGDSCAVDSCDVAGTTRLLAVEDAVAGQVEKRGSIESFRSKYIIYKTVAYSHYLM